MSPTTTWRDWSCTVRVTLDGADPARLAAAEEIVRRLMGDVAGAASRFRADSEIERVNAAPGVLVPLSPLGVRLVEVAIDAARRTDGAVDPTIGAHLLAAGYADDIELVKGRHRTVLPARSRRADWTAVVVDRELGRVGLPPGLRLDLGATAKAWTADEAARRVARNLGHAALVEIGGDLATAGRPVRPWRIAVAEVEDGPAHRVDVSFGGLATSSATSRTWTSGRGVEHHVIDPRTSLPAAGPVRTATVWAPTAVAANTLSTAALVWGAEASDRLEREGATARLVDRSGRVTTIGAWPRVEAASARGAS